MINKIDSIGRYLRAFLWMIAFLVGVCILKGCDKKEAPQQGTLAFWPADMVPHGPHFPQPSPCPPPDKGTPAKKRRTA